jgi:hypothetical protein
MEAHLLSDTSHSMRLRPEQKREIDQAKRMRAEATALRTRVSQGSYATPELQQFWALANSAGVTLFVSNPELAVRAGLGDNFFTTVYRDRRHPKLTNFLRALTAIIEVADERLYDIDRIHDTSVHSSLSLDTIKLRLEQDYVELLALSQSLRRIALAEIEKLDDERPNDPALITANEKQRELLTLFANGFERISAALSKLSDDPHEPVLLGKASEIVGKVGNQVTA